LRPPPSRGGGRGWGYGGFGTNPNIGPRNRGSGTEPKLGGGISGRNLRGWNPLYAQAPCLTRAPSRSELGLWL